MALPTDIVLGEKLGIGLYDAHRGGDALWAVCQEDAEPATPLPAHPNVVDLVACEQSGDNAWLLLEPFAAVSLTALASRHRQALARVRAHPCLECGADLSPFRADSGLEVLCSRCGGMFAWRSLPAGPDVPSHVFVGSPMWLEDALAISRAACAAFRLFATKSEAFYPLVVDQVLFTDAGAIKVVPPALRRRWSSARHTFDTVKRIRYFSPEACLGLPLTAASDVYAISTLTYELACGRHPFEPWSGDLEFLRRIRDHQPPPPASNRGDFPPELEDILLAGLAKKAADRPALDTFIDCIDSVMAARTRPSQASLRAYVCGLKAPSRDWIRSFTS